MFRVLLLFVLYDEDEEGKEYKSKGSRLSSQSESERIDDRCSDVISSLSSTLDVLDTSEDDSEDDIVSFQTVFFFGMCVCVFQSEF